MSRKCPRTLDKPILLVGLEVEDIGVLVVSGGGGGILFGPMISAIIFVAGWITFIRFKKDKPAGYILHWAYSKGSALPGLIPSPAKVKQYGVYTANRISKFTLR